MKPEVFANLVKKLALEYLHKTPANRTWTPLDLEMKTRGPRNLTTPSGFAPRSVGTPLVDPPTKTPQDGAESMTDEPIRHMGMVYQFKDAPSATPYTYEELAKTPAMSDPAYYNTPHPGGRTVLDERPAKLTLAGKIRTPRER